MTGLTQDYAVRNVNSSAIVLFKSLFLTSVLSLCLLSFNAQAAVNLVAKQHSEVWQNLIKITPKSKGVFNRSLRETVRSQLDLPALTSLDVADQELLQQTFYGRLTELDSSLIRFLRVSQSANNFTQLKQLMPALKIIEEYKLIKQLLKANSVTLPALRNQRLMRLLDNRITQIANALIFNMKALVRERRPYEPELLVAMAGYGVEFSARPPDFILQYNLDYEAQNASGQWVFNTHIALTNKLHIAIVKINEVVVVEATDIKQAQTKTLEVMAKLVTMQLKYYLVQNS